MADSQHTWALTLTLGAIAAGALAGCGGGVSDASRTTSRERIESGEIVHADELRVAEYVNYYDQSFAEPSVGQIGLDIRLGNPQLPPDGGNSWLQIGLQARSAHSAEIAPLNLALVLDTSGSMSAHDKMPYLKSAVRRFLSSLAANDRVALVAYSNDAWVLEASRPVGDGGWIESAVSLLAPDGQTNIHAGLLAGIREVDAEYDVRRNNLVILLTDGIANVGQTSPERIAEDAKQMAGGRIQLATIGLGSEFNDELLSRVARENGASYHYIDRPDELDRVFQETVTGLLQKAGSHVTVTIRPARDVEVVSVTGLDGQPPRGVITLQLQDMGTGDSQVILAELSVGPDHAGPRELAEIVLGYRDEFAVRDETVEASAMVDIGLDFLPGYDPLRDREVLRNVTIQRTAEGLREIDLLYHAGRYEEAWELAESLERQLREVERLTGERQMRDDADLMARYKQTLAEWVRSETGRGPGRGEPDGRGLPARGRLPTATGTVLEIK
jgi:Mg-chelatase subunit ChlD